MASTTGRDIKDGGRSDIRLDASADSISGGRPELAWWLALQRAPGIGPVSFQKLLTHYSSPQALFEDKRLPDGLNLPKGLAQYRRAPDWAGVEQDLRWAEVSGQHLLSLADPAYPTRLKSIHNPPPVLFVKGRLDVLNDPQIAIIGSRNPSGGGRETAYAFGRALAEAGLCVTSGLAGGIDTAGHRGALSAGVTIAVAGTSLEQVYPKQNQALADQISEQGALVSEFPIGTSPRRENFPRRNRVISGLSLGVLVIEAALRSGSLITARHALEQGREVFAIPGSIHNPLAKGCHALIRQGAGLVEQLSDILQALESQLAAVINPSKSNDKKTANLDPAHGKVLNSLGFEPTSIDELVERTGMSAEALSASLLALELGGWVSTMPGGGYMRLK